MTDSHDALHAVHAPSSSRGEGLGFDRITHRSPDAARSDQLREGPENLITKAQIAWSAGDLAKAERYITRAAELPWDDFEESHPAVSVSALTSFMLLSDIIEESDPGDVWWLDAVLSCLDEADGVAETLLADHLNVLAFHDAYDLGAPARRRIRSVVGKRPIDRDDPLGPDATPEARASVTRENVRLYCGIEAAVIEAAQELV